MVMLAPRRRPTWRTAAMLVAGIIVGAAVLTPSLGSAAAFLTKAKADKRYLSNSAVATSTTTIPGSSSGSLSVNCPLGRQALSGGADSPFFLGGGSNDGMVITESKPLVAGTRAVGWTVEFITGTSATTVTAHAVCSP